MEERFDRLGDRLRIDERLVPLHVYHDVRFQLRCRFRNPIGAGGVVGVAWDAAYFDEGGDRVSDGFDGADDAESFNVRGETRPAFEAVFTGKHELRIGQRGLRSAFGVGVDAGMPLS